MDRRERIFGVPVIDISSFCGQKSHSDRAKTLRQFNEAFHTVGFAVITGYQSSCDVAYHRLYNAAKTFFSLPLEEKKLHSTASFYGASGYTPPGIETVAASANECDSTGADLVESFLIKSVDEAETQVPACMKGVASAYWKEVDALLMTLMEISSLALELKQDFFNQFFKSRNCTLRLAQYPSSKTSDKPRYGAHTDYTGFTLLRTDSAPGGLEVIDPSSKQWCKIPYQENAFVVNAGDLIQRWTNDFWISNLHRVAPSPSLCTEARLSIVFFTGPSNDTIVTPLSKFCSANSPTRYEPISAGLYLKKKLQRSNKMD